MPSSVPVLVIPDLMRIETHISFFLRVVPVRLFSFLCVSICSMCIGISISIYVK